MSDLHPSKKALAGPIRLQQAALGFGITVMPLAALAAVQFAFLPQIGWLAFHGVAVALVAAYWLITALLGKGPFLRVRAANVTLAFFISAIVARAAYGAIIESSERAKAVCQFLGVSDTDAPFGFDAQSSCEKFFYEVHTTIVWALLGSVALLAASAIIRITRSRRGLLTS